MQVHVVFKPKDSVRTATDVVVNGLDVHFIGSSWNDKSKLLAHRKREDVGGQVIRAAS